MSAKLPLLIELGVEEIPHWMVEPALESFRAALAALLEQSRLEATEIRKDATPRRLVLRIAELAERQEDRTELVMGPPKSAGDGAAAGFARKQGVEPSALHVETTPKGEYFALNKTIAGRATRDILAEALPGIIARIPWPKAMYWTGKGGATFIRPIRWIAALFGEQAVEFEFAGVKSGVLSRGHRRLGKGDIALDHANYEALLRKHGVILSAAERQEQIRKGIKKLLRGTGLVLEQDDALLHDLAYLTEFPTPILGSFPDEFLKLPAEVLVTVMRHHQRYFSVRTKDGKLAPHFIAVMNLKADRKGFVQKGNERVLVARFNDARFFYEVDQQRPLAARIDDLSHVTFVAKAGSYREKIDRMLALAKRLGLESPDLLRAIELAKCDLTAEMVKEFTDLQGVVGGLYARKQGETEGVAAAIYDHYKPLSMDGPIPATETGLHLAIVDKLDTLATCFAIGLQPTGSKDPFALRRAAQGVVKILVEGRLRLDLRTLVGDGGAPQLLDFLLDRVKYYFREVRGFAYDEVNAVLAGDYTDPVDAEARLYALKEVRATENFEALAAAAKRIRNILKQANWQGGTVDAALLEAGPEADLWQEFTRAREFVAGKRATSDYLAALAAIAGLRPAVDRFFDAILVNAPDARVRANRLALLGALGAEFSSIADFSEIVVTTVSN